MDGVTAPEAPDTSGVVMTTGMGAVAMATTAAAGDITVAARRSVLALAIAAGNIDIVQFVKRPG